MQIIQSLGEAMNWLEREISWADKSAELRHLMGRIGVYTSQCIRMGIWRSI
ncbi:hypothetical protein V6B14_21220 [Sporosarcina psychrophila]